MLFIDGSDNKFVNELIDFIKDKVKPHEVLHWEVSESTELGPNAKIRDLVIKVKVTLEEEF